MFQRYQTSSEGGSIISNLRNDDQPYQPLVEYYENPNCEDIDEFMRQPKTGDREDLLAVGAKLRVKMSVCRYGGRLLLARTNDEFTGSSVLHEHEDRLVVRFEDMHLEATRAQFKELAYEILGGKHLNNR